ncbi:MAG: hydrogenase, partial [Planctomycetes bacterium]|nr:hydrogenase [Planctomycetota bacterium]
MTSHELILAGSLTAMASGVPAALLGRRSNAAQAVSTLILVVANAVGAWAVFQWWIGRTCEPLVLPSPLDGVTVSLAIDGLSAFFLLPVLLVTSLASIYGLQYWKQSEHPENGRRVSLFLGILTGAMTLLLVAADGLLFLAAWEVMAVSALFVVAAEDDVAETRRAGWLYIAASHFATLCLFGVFGLLFAINGSWNFGVLHDGSSTAAACLAVLALVGFGTKAGVMPLHVWLPSAHAQAPSHVSAVMSGVFIKMGVYGLVRVATWYPDVPLSWGLGVLALGAVSAVLGVVFAIAQHDIKRLLAYHSIENIGIIVMGLGLALVGRAVNQPVWMLLGICGAMLHVWNHALFKSLLFLGAGSVIHGVGTREIDQMGGLSRRMPWTSVFFLVGAVAICGLPPLNGFVSELFIYLGLFRSMQTPGTTAAAASFAAPALALVGALASACFVKVFGIVFLGAPRSEAAAHSHEGGPAMVVPQLILAACCVTIGVAPILFTGMLERMAIAWGGDSLGELTLSSVAPLTAISAAAAFLAVLV